jgi:predicted small metal-binding protein
MPLQFECFQDGCNFMVRADTDDEIVHLVQEHAQYAHDISIDAETVEAEIVRT